MGERKLIIKNSNRKNVLKIRRFVFICTMHFSRKKGPSVKMGTKMSKRMEFNFIYEPPGWCPTLS